MKLTAQDYIKIGFTTKNAGVTFAKEQGIKIDRKIKIESRRKTDFLKRLKSSRIYINKLQKSQSKNLTLIKKEVNKFNNGIISVLNFNPTLITLKNTISIILSLKSATNSYVIMEVYFSDGTNKIYTLGVNFLQNLEKYVTASVTPGEELSSDGQVYYVLYTSSVINLKFYNKKIDTFFTVKDGAFFKYISNNKLTSIDLTRYQIFNKVDNNNFKENCLIHSLKLAGVEDSKLNDLKIKCHSSVIPKKYIKRFAEDNDYNIVVLYANSNDRDNYNSKSINKIKIGLLDSHYFFIEKTNVTLYSINNYEKVKNLPNWNRVCLIYENGKIKYTNSRFTDSFNLIKALLDNYNNYSKDIDNLLIKPIDISYDTLLTCYPNKISSELKSLEYNTEINTKIVTYKPRINSVKIIVGFDFETRTDKKEGHEAYLVSFNIYFNNKIEVRKTFIGIKCAELMLKYVYKYTCNKLGSNKLEVIFMAHNISYDARFIYSKVFGIKLIERSASNICGGKLKYKPFGNEKIMTIHLKDTYAILPYKLETFQKIFNLNVGKEVIPYNIYNNDTIYDDYPKFSINEAIEELLKSGKCDSDIEQFKKNISEWNLDNNDGMFKHIEYSRIYCERDVEVMCKGYFILKEWLLKDFNLDLDSYLTISSIADAYLKQEGCYEGCYEISGIPRYFIQKCAVGGRTMTNSNKKYHIKEVLNDFDGVSLYPSSMKRINGFLKGKPKVITDLSYDFLKKQDGYFIEIKISKIGIVRDFSLISLVNSDGIRVFSNNVNTENFYYVDKITLEDLINFQKIEFSIIRGYYFNEGHNNIINEKIEYIFNKRCEYKKVGNPIQELYKLIMNGSYGKTLLKEKNTKNIIFDSEEKMNKYVDRNYNYIIEIIQFVNCKKFKVKVVVPIAEHFNCCHIGVEILSMSKRIMNEVMCTAEDMGIKIYYQDTDSMHIPDNRINDLSKRYYELYNRELIGNKLGQFHTDFEEIKGVKPVAVESIILGKKVYIDKLEYSMPDNTKKIDYHYRLKGVPQNVVMKKAVDNYNGDIMSLYKDLHKGNTIEFDLLSCGFKMDMCSDYTIKTKEKFTRKIKF